MPVDPAPLLSGAAAQLRERTGRIGGEVGPLDQRGRAEGGRGSDLFPAGGDRAVGMARGDRRSGGVRTLYRARTRDVGRALQGRPNDGRFRADERAGSRLRCRWREQLARAPAAALCGGPRFGDPADHRAHRGLLSGAGRSRRSTRKHPDDNVVWAFHSYDPFLLTHQGATWAGDFIQLCDRACRTRPMPSHAANSRPRGAIRQSMRDEAPLVGASDGMIDYLDEQIATMDTKARARRDDRAAVRDGSWMGRGRTASIRRTRCSASSA